MEMLTDSFLTASAQTYLGVYGFLFVVAERDDGEQLLAEALDAWIGAMLRTIPTDVDPDAYAAFRAQLTSLARQQRQELTQILKHLKKESSK